MAFEDFKLASFCDHKIYDERIVVDGVTPNFYCSLKYPTNGDASKIEFRDYCETEGMTNYNFLSNGITDFTMGTDNKTIVFNNYIGQSGVNYIEGNTQIFPKKVYLASYITEKSHCPKCLGTLKISDISFNNVGQLSTVKNRDLIKQKIVKSLLTLKGTNLFYNNYGSSLTQAIGKPNIAFSILFIQQAIFDAINNLMAIQSDVVSILADEEILMGIDNLQVSPGTDARQIIVTLTVLIGTYDKLNISFNMTV